MSLSTLVLGAGLVLDAVVGEPPQRLHPVAWFGRLVGPVDRTWTRPRPVGILVALCLPVGAGLVVAGSILAASAVSWLAGAALGAVWLFVSTSLRRLLVRVRDVVLTTETDPDTARERLRALAGRDAAALSPGQVRSAALESLAENLADGLVSPLLAFTLATVAVTGLGVGESTLFGAGGVVAVAAGCGTAAWVKAVNTLDSMLGYYATPTGWGPARLDDAVQYLPARVSALLLAGVCLQPRAVLTARDWQTEVSSPNSGWPMGTLAAALDVRLEKPDHYVLNPEGTLPDVTTAAVAIRNVGVAGILAYALAGVVTWL